MKIRVKNLGALKQAEFTLGDLTIVCGCNNTGKTYATYALFGFLDNWRRIFSIEIKDDKIEQLLVDGVIRLDIEQYLQQSEQIVSKACETYTQQLPNVFAAPNQRFRETEFQISLDIQNINLTPKFELTIGTANVEIFSINKNQESSELVVTLLVEKDKATIPREILKRTIADALKEIIFAKIIPRPFIASAERTGAAIFRKELNFARNRLLEEMGQAGSNINPMELLFKVYQDYALPIKTNVDFTRELETIFKKSSFIAEDYPDILADFANIIGGEYTVTRNDELYYVPKGKRAKLSMDESSSAVRSLLDIGFYLRHEAQPGDLLMVDEPELNLHHDEVIIIDVDTFVVPREVFNGEKGECKRADFVIITNTEIEKIILCIEMKKKKDLEKKIIQQFKGAQCFVAYCKEIGKAFWHKPNFLDDYQYRFVSIGNISVSKTPTRIERKTGIHDRPDRMLKIKSPNNLQFDRLI